MSERSERAFRKTRLTLFDSIRILLARLVRSVQQAVHALWKFRQNDGARLRRNGFRFLCERVRRPENGECGRVQLVEYDFTGFGVVLLAVLACEQRRAILKFFGTISLYFHSLLYFDGERINDRVCR